MPQELSTGFDSLTARPSRSAVPSDRPVPRTGSSADTVLAENQFSGILAFTRTVFALITLGVLFLLADGYFEGVARAREEPDQSINHAHDKLSSEDDEE